jgi:hypothetical protein
MIFMLAALILSAAGYCVIRKQNEKESHLVRTIFVRTPPSVVFNLISRIDRLPEWYRAPGRSFRLFARSHLSQWGALIPPEWRLDQKSHGKRIQVVIQPTQNKEFRYQYHDPREVRYELIFRLRSRNNVCLLIWEIRYKMCRWLDILLNRKITEREIYKNMGWSLDLIRRMAEEITGPSFLQNEIEQRNRLKSVSSL